METDRYAYYEQIVGEVGSAISKIQRLEEKYCYDINYLERIFIPSLGLNDEILNEQPTELNMCYGKGLHIWQYPAQLARYLVWLTNNAKKTKKYIEIGCRWGGTFILVNEWLKKIGASLECSIAVDPIEPTPFIKKYMEISNTPVIYLKNTSASREVTDYIELSRPDMFFIDGDHDLSAVMLDHLIARKWGNIIVHHDVCSQACPGSTFFWAYLCKAETDFDHIDFTQQYASVDGRFLGIGALRRKTPLVG